MTRDISRDHLDRPQHPATHAGTIDQPSGLSLAAVGHEPMPVLQAIRAKCLDYSCGNKTEVADCLVRDCPLWPFRIGRNPWRAGPSQPQRETRRRSAQKTVARFHKRITLIEFGATAEVTATSLPSRLKVVAS